MSDSLQHHGLQRTRLPCPSPAPGACSYSMSIASVMPSNYLILCRLLLLPSVFPSIRVFSNESALYIRWPKYWSLSFSISPSNEYWEVISFRIDWFDLLAVQGILRSLLQHHISKSSTWQIHGILVFLAFDACPRWGVQVFVKCIQTPCDTKITTQILLYTFEKVYPLQLSSKVEVAK